MNLRARIDKLKRGTLLDPVSAGIREWRALPPAVTWAWLSDDDAGDAAKAVFPNAYRLQQGLMADLFGMNGSAAAQ